jgi:hypothetical protein
MEMNIGGKTAKTDWKFFPESIDRQWCGSANAGSQ